MWLRPRLLLVRRRLFVASPAPSALVLANAFISAKSLRRKDPESGGAVTACHNALQKRGPAHSTSASRARTERRWMETQAREALAQADRWCVYSLKPAYHLRPAHFSPW